MIILYFVYYYDGGARIADGTFTYLQNGISSAPRPRYLISRTRPPAKRRDLPNPEDRAARETAAACHYNRYDDDNVIHHRSRPVHDREL